LYLLFIKEEESNLLFLYEMQKQWEMERDRRQMENLEREKRREEVLFHNFFL
jgi:hypothetical protein